MKIRISLALFLVMLFTTVSIAADFSADMTITTRGEKDAKGKITMQGSKVRMEIQGSDDEKMVTISRPDKKLVWILMPGEKMFMEQPYQENPRVTGWSPSREAESKLVGEETVSGLACRNYQVQGKETFYWVSDKINFPVKTQDPEGTMLLKNIRIGKVPANLFEVPAGYEKFSMPGMGGPGGMPGMAPGFPGIPMGK